jgi:hypothetical protein
MLSETDCGAVLIPVLMAWAVQAYLDTAAHINFSDDTLCPVVNYMAVGVIACLFMDQEWGRS